VVVEPLRLLNTTAIKGGCGLVKVWGEDI
jgi:hypothetical protein